MMQRARWRSCLRSAVLVALVLAIAAPVVVARAADDVATAVQAQLPQGSTVTYTQAADIGGDGQMEAIFKAQSSPAANMLLAEIVGVAALQGGTWVIQSQSTPYPDSGTAADIFVYPKNSQHPGFVITNQHICGANCNGGEYALMQYTGGKFTTALSGINDRGELSADPATGSVTLSGPVYTNADPRCCPEYNYARTWTWQGTSLMPGTLSFAPAPD